MKYIHKNSTAGKKDRQCTELPTFDLGNQGDF